jgi:hypothetical protein
MAGLELSGPLESGQFPDKLTARVITPGARARVHGYDVESDLAVHYGATELVLLSLTGELPGQPARAAFEVAWLFLAPVSVAHAGPHATVLARLCGATTSSTLGVAAIGLAEQARALVTDHAELLRWLKSKAEALPERYRSQDLEEQASVERLRRALAGTGLVVQALEQSPTRDAALVSVLFACGLRRPEQLQAAIVLARLPSALAEGFAERATNFANYPINLPAFAYQESR